ncbi:MAG TPA: hypothetical protein VF054_05995 [Micromonosporaceae bacterium]
MRGARWVTTGLVDQVVIASANAGMTLLAAALLPRDRAGALLLSIGLGYLVLALNRAFVGDVLLAKASRLGGGEHDRLVRDGLASAIVVGVAAAAVLLGVWVFWRRPGTEIDLQDLVWLAPFLPMILLHDTGRYSYLADRQQQKALVIDLVWVGTQATLITVSALAGYAHTAATLPVSWGLGATAGAATYLVRSRQQPWRGHPRQWVARTRDLSGWFVATMLVGQLQVQAVGFLVAGRLGRPEVAGLRAAQTALLQPVQNFSMAIMGLLVPRSSRLAAGRDAAGLRRQTVRVGLAFVGLAALTVLVAVPLARLVLSHIPKYADLAALALPIALQAGIYLVQIPFSAAIRGMQRGALLFLQYLIFTATSLTGLMIGTGHGLVGAAWGLTCGAGVGLVAQIACYAWAVRRIDATGSAEITESVSAGVPG